MNPGDLSSMSRDQQEDYLARREMERRIQEGSFQPVAQRSPCSQRDRRQVSAWMKGGLREFLGDNQNRRGAS